MGNKPVSFRNVDSMTPARDVDSGGGDSTVGWTCTVCFNSNDSASPSCEVCTMAREAGPHDLPDASPQQNMQVQIPPGVSAGMQFQVQAGDQVIVVTCPPGAEPGSVIAVQVPVPSAPAPPPAAAVAVAQAVPVAYAVALPPRAAAQNAYVVAAPSVATVALQTKHKGKKKKKKKRRNRRRHSGDGADLGLGMGLGMGMGGRHSNSFSGSDFWSGSDGVSWDSGSFSGGGGESKDDNNVGWICNDSRCEGDCGKQHSLTGEE